MSLKAKDELLNTSIRYNYFNLPKPNLKNVIVSSKQWNDIWNKEIFNSKSADGNLVSNDNNLNLVFNG